MKQDIYGSKAGCLLCICHELAILRALSPATGTLAAHYNAPDKIHIGAYSAFK
jgi:hypothetical protein